MRRLVPFLFLFACSQPKEPHRPATFMCNCMNDDSQPARVAVEGADPKSVRVDDHAYVPVTPTLGMAISTGFHRVSVATHEIEIFASAGCTHVLRTTEYGLEDEPVCAGTMGALASIPPPEPIPPPDGAHVREWIAARVAAIARVEASASKLVGTAKKQKDVILLNAAQDKEKLVHSLRVTALEKQKALETGSISPEQALREVHALAARARQIALELPQVIAIDCACDDWSADRHGDRTEVMIVVAPDDFDRVADPHRVLSAHVFVDGLEVLSANDPPGDPRLDGRLTTAGLVSVGTHAVRATIELAPLAGGPTQKAAFSGTITVPAAPFYRVKLSPPALAGSTISTRSAQISLTCW
ncbi:MAG: hypothetical protein ACXWUG_11525 [Polyangiales bacterium]